MRSLQPKNALNEIHQLHSKSAVHRPSIFNATVSFAFSSRLRSQAPRPAYKPNGAATSTPLLQCLKQTTPLPPAKNPKSRWPSTPALTIGAVARLPTRHCGFHGCWKPAEHIKSPSARLHPALSRHGNHYYCLQQRGVGTEPELSTFRGTGEGPANVDTPPEVLDATDTGGSSAI